VLRLIRPMSVAAFLDRVSRSFNEIWVHIIAVLGKGSKEMELTRIGCDTRGHASCKAQILSESKGY
jgi:hypothetical protein